MGFKIAIFAKKNEGTKELIQELNCFKSKWEIDDKNPQIVITYGGDGTFLAAERFYPGIPKLILRKNSLCKKCHCGELDGIFKRLFEGAYVLQKHKKVEIILNGKKIDIFATNDVTLRNALQTHALRFDVHIGDKIYENVIGDGIVVATAFGSTGYFHSITRKTFDEHLGLTFNNATQFFEPVLGIEIPIKVKIKRSRAFLSFDNYEEFFEVKENDVLEIRQSSEEFAVVKIKQPETEY